MFHHRVTLAGTDDALTAAGAELVAMGATPVGPARFITALTDGGDAWRPFAENHPSVRISVELFEEFEDEFVEAIVTKRGNTNLFERSVLPQRFGCSDEDGEPIPKELLTAAGRAIAGDRLAHDVGTLSSPLDDALTMGTALGRFCAQVEESVFEPAGKPELEAVRELAVFAWWITVADQAGGTPVELEFDHALVLTQAVVQAGREELWDRPGHACWMSWVETIVGCAAEVIQVGSEQVPSPDGQLGLSARSLLTTCIQALALFGRADA